MAPADQRPNSVGCDVLVAILSNCSYIIQKHASLMIFFYI